MTSILRALMTENIRVSNVNRWLVWDEALDRWAVYGREYAQKKTRTLVVTNDQDEAVKYLLYREAD